MAESNGCFCRRLADEAGFDIDQTKFTAENWIGAAIETREKGIYNQEWPLARRL